MGQINKLMERDGGMVRTITAIAHGQQAWYRVKLSPATYSAYCHNMRRGTLDIANYGEIIASGWGVPPENQDDLLS